MDKDQQVNIRELHLVFPTMIEIEVVFEQSRAGSRSYDVRLLLYEDVF